MTASQVNPQSPFWRKEIGHFLDPCPLELCREPRKPGNVDYQGVSLSDINIISDNEIIQRCKQATPDLLLSCPESDNKIFKLNNRLVVKFGFLLSEDEARNQAKACEILDPSIVRVPRVYRYFKDVERRGYIVMDYMEGERKESITESRQISDMSRILQHFASIKSQRPGPLIGGPSCCFLFGESDYPTFTSVADMETWFNVRLLDPRAKISFAELDLVFCHLDLFPRNILWLDCHPPCVLDWASAGFYPHIFERCSQLISQQPEENKVILGKELSQFEAIQVDLILKAWWNNMQYCFVRPTPEKIKFDFDLSELPPHRYPTPSEEPGRSVPT